MNDECMPHLQASEQVDSLSRGADPHVQGLPLLHHHAWRQQRAACITEALFSTFPDAVQLREHAPQRLVGVVIELLLSLKGPCAHTPCISEDASGQTATS
jgi:hypothetical protein